jgi:predicted outer membrane repeat protein
MIKKMIFVFLCSMIGVLSFSTLASAASVVEAPGGTVSSYEELVTALGGSDAAILEKNHLLIISDIRLSAPIVFVEGSYEIRGAGIEITADFHDNSFLIVGGEKKTTLAIGNSTNDAPDVDIVFNGEGMTRDGAFLYINNGSSVTMYKGVTMEENITSIMGGAIYCDGGFVLYGGTITNCRSTGSGGAIASKGEVLLPSGIIQNCSADFGGAVYSEGKLSLLGTEFQNCSAQKGGAIFNTGDLQLVSSTIQSCHASQGGGLYNSGIAELKGGQILSCKTDDGEGGGAYNSGTASLKGTYFKDNQGKNGGSYFNVGETVIQESILQDSKASAYGGIIYNDVTGKLTVKGGALSRGEAKYGGGVYNLGTFHYERGGFALNKADVGKGILNEGSLIFSQYPYLDEKNDVAIVVTEDNIHAIEIQTQMKAELICYLTPYVKNEDGYHMFYEEGIVLLVGDYAGASASRFAVTSQNGVEWTVSSDGTLAEPIPVYFNPWFYAVILTAFVVTVAVMVLLIRFFDKRKTVGKT